MASRDVASGSAAVGHSLWIKVHEPFQIGCRLIDVNAVAVGEISAIDAPVARQLLTYKSKPLLLCNPHLLLSSLQCMRINI